MDAKQSVNDVLAVLSNTFKMNNNSIHDFLQKGEEFRLKIMQEFIEMELNQKIECISDDSVGRRTTPRETFGLKQSVSNSIVNNSIQDRDKENCSNPSIIANRGSPFNSTPRMDEENVNTPKKEDGSFLGFLTFGKNFNKKKDIRYMTAGDKPNGDQNSAQKFLANLFEMVRTPFKSCGKQAHIFKDKEAMRAHLNSTNMKKIKEMNEKASETSMIVNVDPESQQRRELSFRISEKLPDIIFGGDDPDFDEQKFIEKTAEEFDKFPGLKEEISQRLSTIRLSSINEDGLDIFALSRDFSSIQDAIVGDLSKSKLPAETKPKSQQSSKKGFFSKHLSNMSKESQRTMTALPKMVNLEDSFGGYELSDSDEEGAQSTPKLEYKNKLLFKVGGTYTRGKTDKKLQDLDINSLHNLHPSIRESDFSTPLKKHREIPVMGGKRLPLWAVETDLLRERAIKQEEEGWHRRVFGRRPKKHVDLGKIFGIEINRNPNSLVPNFDSIRTSDEEETN